MRIAACDGRPSFVCELKSILDGWARADYLKIEFQQYLSPDDLLAEMELHGHIDLVFLDMQPGERERVLAAARSLRKEDEASEIAFVSSRGEFDREVLALRPLDYLKKPLCSQHVYELLERCIQIREKQKFTFRSRQRLVALYVEKILYIYHVRRKIYIYYMDGREFETYMRLEEAEQLLKGCDAAFWKAHYSYLVNLYYVEQLKRGSITLENGTEIPVSRPYMSQLMSYFEAYSRIYPRKSKSVQKNGKIVQSQKSRPLT